MDKSLKFYLLKQRMLVFVVFLVFSSFSFGWSLNKEGLALLSLKNRVVSDPFGALSDWNDDVGVTNHCSWLGVECSDGKVVALNLRDLCLEGTLAPELADLVHMKSIILRNNSFEGIIPEGIGLMKELEVLDLGYNNFTGALPRNLGSNLSLIILLLDNNEFLDSLSPEIYELQRLSELQVDENQLSSAVKESSCCKRFITWNKVQGVDKVHRRLQQEAPPPVQMVTITPDRSKRNQTNSTIPPSESPSDFQFGSIAPSEARSANETSPTPDDGSVAPGPDDGSVAPGPDDGSVAPGPDDGSLAPAQKDGSVAPAPKDGSVAPAPNSSAAPDPVTSPTILKSGGTSSKHLFLISVASVGGAISLIVLVTGIYLFRNNTMNPVRPWRSGLSGQLQKAFLTGVPSLKRSELEAACEDFSNVIGTSPIGTVYKGTLSSGVEIAVVSVAVRFTQNWSRNLEVQFRSKIDTLSKMNHKNFVNLLGYCEENVPFTRMMVFEYAPNGTLFEHLHIRESEHLDWVMRLRIVMGLAYCLENMHQLDPPTAHNHLTSSSVSLTEDYAAKISDFSFLNDGATNTGKSGKKLEDTPPVTRESNVYSFGVLLFELMTGRLPYSVDDNSHDWASNYLRGVQPLRPMVDPTMESYNAEQLDHIGEVIRLCVNPDPKQRPPMREVTARLREITNMSAEGAFPKLSPLWWAELEILSTEVN